MCGSPSEPSAGIVRIRITDKGGYQMKANDLMRTACTLHFRWFPASSFQTRVPVRLCVFFELDENKTSHGPLSTELDPTTADSHYASSLSSLTIPLLAILLRTVV